MIKKTKSASEALQHAREYAETLVSIKKEIAQAQLKAVAAANKEMALLYWSIGKTLFERADKSSWGTSVMERLAKDLQTAFPGIAGFSKTNVFRMKAFFIAYSKIPTAVGKLEYFPVFKIPWGHNVVLLERIKTINERLWYAQKTIDHGWSRSMLDTWIKAKLYQREGKAITNFKRTLPSPSSDLAHQALKDPYLLDFLSLHKEHLEKEVEDGLVSHIQNFLVELGQGFAFVGRQYHLVVDEKDYYIDLLFYNFKLRSFVVIELKARDFDPRDTGQISFYLAAIDSTLKHEDDKPTIGLILCKNKKSLTVEYALRSNVGPIGVASYETHILENLPKEFKGSLPTIEEIEAELAKKDILFKKYAQKTKPDGKPKLKKVPTELYNA